MRREGEFGWLVGWFLNVLVNYWVISRTGPKTECLTIFRGMPNTQRRQHSCWETMTSVSAGHIIQTPTQPVGSGRPQQYSNPGPPHQVSRVLPTELQRPPPPPEKERERERRETERESRERQGHTLERDRENMEMKTDITKSMIQ